MPRDLRYIPPDSLVEITNRTLQGRFLLRPSLELNTIVHGALGRAQRRYDVQVVGEVFLSNHFHMLALVDDAEQLARFVGYFQAKIAKEAGRLHDWRGKFWERRYRAIIVSNEPEVQVGRLHYVLEQGCKEGLVASPKHWPGSSSTQAMLTGKPIEGLWFDRTQEHKARQKGTVFGRFEFATEESVVLTPLPCWRHKTPEKRQARARAMVRTIEAEVERKIQLGGAPPMGVQAILAQHPHDRPARSKRSPAPRFHAKSGQVRRSLERAYQRFFWSYRGAAARLRDGLGKATFPPGSFPPAARFVAPLPASGFG